MRTSRLSLKDEGSRASVRRTSGPRRLECPLRSDSGPRPRKRSAGCLVPTVSASSAPGQYRATYPGEQEHQAIERGVAGCSGRPPKRIKDRNGREYSADGRLDDGS